MDKQQVTGRTVALHSLHSHTPRPDLLRTALDLKQSRPVVGLLVPEVSNDSKQRPAIPASEQVYIYGRAKGPGPQDEERRVDDRIASANPAV